MKRIRVAIQKSGRLSEKSLDLLQRCGLRFARSKDKLYWYGKDFPIDLLLPLLEHVRGVVVVEAGPGQLEDELRLALSQRPTMTPAASSGIPVSSR